MLIVGRDSARALASPAAREKRRIGGDQESALRWRAGPGMTEMLRVGRVSEATVAGFAMKRKKSVAGYGRAQRLLKVTEAITVAIHWRASGELTAGLAMHRFLFMPSFILTG